MYQGLRAAENGTVATPSIVVVPAIFWFSAPIESEKLTFGVDSMLNDTDRPETTSSFTGSQLLPSDLIYFPDQAPPSFLNSKVQSL